MTGDEEWNTFKRGPRAVLAAVEERATELNLSVLAQACAREARHVPVANAAIEWTNAAVACYFAEAKLLPAGVIRQGAELGAMGCMANTLLRFGTETESAAAYLPRIRAWLEDALQELTDPQDVRHNPLVLERLRTTKALWNAGLLSEDLAPWFAAAEGK
jgi:hypothetical protein